MSELSQPYNFTEWDLGALQATAKLLSFEKANNPIPRQRDTADRELGHIAFELWARSHHDVRTPATTTVG
jgi:hypothetical protein